MRILLLLFLLISSSSKGQNKLGIDVGAGSGINFLVEKIQTKNDQSLSLPLSLVLGLRNVLRVKEQLYLSYYGSYSTVSVTGNNFEVGQAVNGRINLFDNFILLGNPGPKNTLSFRAGAGLTIQHYEYGLNIGSSNSTYISIALIPSVRIFRSKTFSLNFELPVIVNDVIGTAAYIGGKAPRSAFEDINVRTNLLFSHN